MNTKQDPLVELLQLLAAVSDFPTPSIDVKEDNPLQGYLGEGPCTVVQFGDDNYHCMLMVQTSLEIPPAVLSRLFLAVFQEGLSRNEAVLKRTRDMDLAISLATMKTVIVNWLEAFPKPEGARELTIPFVVRWNVMGTVEMNHAKTFISYGMNRTPEEVAEIERNFHAMDTPEARDDTTPLH